MTLNINQAINLKSWSGIFLPIDYDLFLRRKNGEDPGFWSARPYTFTNSKLRSKKHSQYPR